MNCSIVPQRVRKRVLEKYENWRNNHGDAFWASRSALSQIDISTNTAVKDIVNGSDHIRRQLVHVLIKSKVGSPKTKPNDSNHTTLNDNGARQTCAVSQFSDETQDVATTSQIIATSKKPSNKRSCDVFPSEEIGSKAKPSKRVMSKRLSAQYTSKDRQKHEEQWQYIIQHASEMDLKTLAREFFTKFDFKNKSAVYDALHSSLIAAGKDDLANETK
ncbi:hypothetical protein BGX21_009422, partial [Mortierella sp. AD011]